MSRPLLRHQRSQPGACSDVEMGASSRPPPGASLRQRCHVSPTPAHVTKHPTSPAPDDVVAWTAPPQLTHWVKTPSTPRGRDGPAPRLTGQRGATPEGLYVLHTVWSHLSQVGERTRANGERRGWCRGLVTSALTLTPRNGSAIPQAPGAQGTDMADGAVDSAEGRHGDVHPGVLRPCPPDILVSSEGQVRTSGPCMSPINPQPRFSRHG